MEYIVRLMRFFLAVMYLSVVLAGCAAIPSAVPGKTLGSPLLQRDTMNQLFSSDRIAASECQSRKIVNMEVLEQTKDPQFVAGQMVAGKWKERWYLDRCGKIIPYDVQYTADGKGGTFISFLVGGATETAKAAGTEPSVLDAGLLEATLKSDSARIEQLLADGAKIEAIDKHGRTPLKIAADKGNAAIVTLLLKKGSNVNSMNGGETALHAAALRREQDVVRILLEHGANANQKGWNDLTPLFRAVTSGKVEIIKMLLEHGADINARAKPNVIGETPLMWAASGGKSEIVQFLMRNGADAKARGSDGKTVLGSTSLWCLSADALKDLLEHGEYKQVDINKAFLVGSSVNTGAGCANQESFLDYVKFFMDNGVDVNAKSEYGDTALVLGSRWGYPDGVRFLLSKGADVSNTALKVAKTSEIRQLLKDAKR